MAIRCDHCRPAGSFACVVIELHGMILIVVERRPIAEQLVFVCISPDAFPAIFTMPDVIQAVPSDLSTNWSMHIQKIADKQSFKERHFSSRDLDLSNPVR